MRYSSDYDGPVDAITEIDRARQSIGGWRWALDYACELIGELATLKGAQAYRGKIDTARHEIARALAAGDLVILRNSTAVADMAIALAEAERALPGKAWLFARGRARPGEPEYGFAVFATRDGIGDEAPLVLVEHDDPRECVRAAVAKMGKCVEVSS